jgi:hypothetical protein
MVASQFTYVPPAKSGIQVEGEVRDARVVQVNGSKCLLVGRNNASVLMFKKH